MLQLVKDEARHEQNAIDETGLAYVGDAPVYDGAGINQEVFVELEAGISARV